jgi:hypothetical protein
MNAASFFRLARGVMFLAACWAFWNHSPGNCVAFADSPVRVVRIEEDWELVVATSDLNSIAPQVCCVFSPVNNLDSIYGCVELNHRSLPSFRGGGIQLQAWEGGAALAFRDWTNVAMMSTNQETVRWTQAMTLEEEQLVFQVMNGTSGTWGAFGDPTPLAATVSTNLHSLNGYNTALSVNNSGISYAANRVKSLVLKRVRYIVENGDVYEDGTERIVYSDR